MEFVELTEKEFRNFAYLHVQGSYMQTIELKKFKEASNKKCYIVGVKKNNNVVAATILTPIGTFLGKTRYYSSRGFIIDYNDFDLLQFFTNNIKKFIKRKNGLSITIDPNVIYRTRNSDGQLIDDKVNDKVINNLKKVGFKHYGFNTYLETLQVRWVYRIELNDTYDNLKNNFSKSTRKNIESTYNNGVVVRKGNINDLKSLSEIFEETAKRDDFNSKSYDYYKAMYKDMKDLITIFIAYIDPKKYISNIEDKLKQEKENNNNIKHKMEVDMVGSKLLNKKQTSDNLIKKYNEELKTAKAFIKKYPKGKDIGALISIESGSEYVTLSSGTLTDYKKYNPKYALYDAHIKDAYEKKYKYVNFYGITGDFSKENKFYGIYEFKKGFNGSVIEYIGEFTIGIDIRYKLFNFLKNIKKIIKKIIRR